MTQPRTAAGRALLEWLDFARGRLDGIPQADAILAIEAEAASPSAGLRASVLDDLAAAAGVIADEEAYTRLLRFIASRRAALAPAQGGLPDPTAYGGLSPEEIVSASPPLTRSEKDRAELDAVYGPSSPPLTVERLARALWVTAGSPEPAWDANMDDHYRPHAAAILAALWKEGA